MSIESYIIGEICHFFRNVEIVIPRRLPRHEIAKQKTREFQIERKTPNYFDFLDNLRDNEAVVWRL